MLSLKSWLTQLANSFQREERARKQTPLETQLPAAAIRLNRQLLEKLCTTFPARLKHLNRPFATCHLPPTTRHLAEQLAQFVKKKVTYQLQIAVQVVGVSRSTR